MASYKVPPPVFSDDTTFPDWKIDVNLWSRSILDTQLNKSQKAIILYQSLKNEVKKTILSEIGIDDIDHVDGIKNIFKAMSSYYEKDQVKSGCVALDKLMNKPRLYRELTGEDINIPNVKNESVTFVDDPTYTLRVVRKGPF